MKFRILCIFFLCTCAQFRTEAQDYEPREGWPFVFDNFRSGTTRTRDGGLVMDALLNISVTDGSLFFIDNDRLIMQADMSKVYTVKTGDDVYVNLSGKLYKLLSELDKGYVVSRMEVDVDKYSKVDIGYGVSSASASAMNLTILMDGRSNLIKKNIDESNANKYSSPVIPTKESRFLWVGGNLIPASRNAIVNYPGVDKKKAQEFIKQEKIRWKDTISLEKLVIFLAKQLSD